MANSHLLIHYNQFFLASLVIIAPRKSQCDNSVILVYLEVGVSQFSLLLRISHIFLTLHRMSNLGLYDGYREYYSVETILL